MLCPDYYITMMFLEDWCEKRRLFRFKTTNGVILKNSQNLTNLCLQHAILFYMNMNNVEFGSSLDQLTCVRRVSHR